MTRLVVNADDFGLNADIDAGILRARTDGILTSATVLVTGSCAASAVKAGLDAGLGLGVHLCLSTGLPPAAQGVPTVAPGGRFRPSWTAFARDWALGRIRREEVARELEAQVDRARELGFAPDHLDGHQHLHVLPGVKPIVTALASRHRLPVRWPTGRPASMKSWLLAALGGGSPGLPMWGASFAGRLDEARLLRLLTKLPRGDVEVGAHPGRSPKSVPEDPAWRYRWEEEMAALISPAVKGQVQRLGITLTTYASVFAGQLS